MSWAILTLGREDWWASTGGGWATCVVLALLLGLYAVRSLTWPMTWSFPHQISSQASPSSSSSGNGIDVADGDFPIVTEADLQRLLMLLNESGHSDRVPWIPVVDKHSETLSYHAKLRDSEDGTPTQYLSTSLFRNCSAKQLRDFYMDNDYRIKWDSTFESYKQLDVSEETGVEVGCFIRRFPFMRPREYVLAWRLWEGEDGSFYYFAKHCKHPQAPQDALYTSVEHYLSGWRIQKAPDNDACEIKMWHQEDTTPMVKMAFSYRIWNYMCIMEKSLRKYRNTQHNEARNAVTLAQKVPSGLLKSITFPAALQPPTSLRSKSNSGYKKKKLSIRQTGKWMANGILVLGGAVFCTRGSAPLGAKIAAVYAIRKLVKPSPSMKQIRQQYSGF